MALSSLQSQDLSQQVVDADSNAVFVYELVRDRKGRAAAFKLRKCNPAADRLLARPEVEPILELLLPERASEELFQEYTSVTYGTRSMTFDKVIEDKDGTVSVALAIEIRPVSAGVAMIVADTTEKTRELRGWKRRTERLQLLARRSRDVVSLHTPDGFYVWASDSALRVLGLDADALRGSHITERLHPEDAAQLKAEPRLPVGQTLRLRSADTGEERWLELRFEGHGRQILVTMRDVTKVRALEIRAAAADPVGLDGVRSRDVFLSELEKEISRRRRYGRPVTVVAIAVDQHKAILAQRGDEGVRATQEALAEVSRTVLRNVDMIGQWSDEIFLLLLPETPAVGGLRASERLAERLAAQAVEGVGKPFRVTLGAGVTAVDANDSPKTVLARAGRNLSLARKKGQGVIAQDSDHQIAA